MNQTSAHRRKLFSGLSWTVVGNAVYSCCQWGLIVILTKLMTAEVVGVYSLALSITTPIILLFQMNLKIVQATDARREFHFNAYFSLRVFLTVAAMACIALVSWMIGKSVLAIMIVVLVGMAKASESISDVCYGMFLQNERMDVMGMSLVTRSVMSLLLFSALVHFLDNVLVGLGGLVVVWVMMLVVYDMRKVLSIIPEPVQNEAGREPQNGLKESTFIPRWDIPAFHGILLLGLPMGIAAVLDTLIVYIPRYCIAYFSGDAQLGIFTALSYLLLAVSLVVGSITMASVPRLAKYHAEGLRREFMLSLLQVFGIISVICLSLMLVVFFFGEEIVTILYTDQYARYAYLLTWFAAAGIFMFTSSLLSIALISMRKFGILMIISLSGVIGILAASLILVPSHGLIGAVWAITINAVFVLLVQTIVVLSMMRRRKTGERQPHVGIPKK